MARTGLLNDMAYEAVNWNNYTPTVTLVGGAGNTVPVYTTNTGRWSRTGKLVNVEIYLTGDGGNEGAGSGILTIALPFTSGANQATSYVAAGILNNNVTFGYVLAQVAASTSVVSLGYFSAASTFIAAPGSIQNNTTRTIRMNFWYEAV